MYVLPEVKKGYKSTKMCKEDSDSKIASDHFAGCDDGLVFLDGSEIIKMEPLEDDNCTFEQEESYMIEEDEDEVEDKI